MVGLCWAALVALVLLRSAGHSLAEVDQNELAGIVTELLSEYRPSYKGSNNKGRFPMFSVAVKIPCNKDRKAYDMSLVTRGDSSNDVRGKILNCEVYTGSRVAAATVLRWPNVLDQCPDGPVPWDRVLKQCNKKFMTWADVDRECPEAVWDGAADHAEYRVLQHFNNLLNNIDEDDLLLFYILASPCDKRCTNERSQWSILESINQIMNWKNYAVVFSNVFQPRGDTIIPEQHLKDALQRLGTHKGPKGQIGLRNIFRCNKWRNEMVCNSCLDGNKIAPYCYSDNVQPSINQPQPGRSNSPSHCGQAGSGSISPHTGLSTNIDSNTGGGQGEGGGGRRRRRRGRGKNRQNVDTGDDVSLQQSGLENRETSADTGGGLGDGRGRSNSVTSGAGVQANDDSNTGGGGGGGGGLSGRGKARRVGGRRVGKKRKGGGNKQASNQGQRKKKEEDAEQREDRLGSDFQSRAGEEQSERRRKSRREKQRGGLVRINQPLKRG